MPDRPTLRLVDSHRTAPVDFPPPDPVPLGRRGRETARPQIAVGPGRAVTAAPNRDRAEAGAGVSYPIQPGKVQAPALRDETLARTRLLDWLEAKINSRVVFVIADAGYGKTTLLADFSRRSRHRTLWYRLAEDDREWVGFVAHLVAAGREHDPEFAPQTTAMLRSLEPGGPTREAIVETFLSELPAIAEQGAVLIFDDFHLADEVADVRDIVREIITRGPERLSVVFASRRTPPIPVSKLRTLGEVAELGIADLRFSETELEQLFRETYGRPLEPDIVSELSRRTEGWAASLTLVRAALRERSASETRAFIRGLSGARDELHDYLAEEVVGDLPRIHQQFLMRTSVLQIVTPELAQVATGLSAVEVQSLMLESERLGLLGRRPNRRSADQRYHPLVREFLEDRLLRGVGATGVRELHIAIAAWAEPTDWQTAAHHYTSAERWDDLHRVLDEHLEHIVASGAFVAAALVPRIPNANASAAAHVILSRAATASGDFSVVSRHAERAADLAPERDVVITNLIAAKALVGSVDVAKALATQVAARASGLQREIAEAFSAVLAASLDGDIDHSIRLCEALATRCAGERLYHAEGVGWLNAGLGTLATGHLDRAGTFAARAIDALTTSSSSAELAAARSLDAAVLSLSGRLGEGRLRFAAAVRTVGGDSRAEILSEYAEIEALVGDGELAAQLLSGRDRRVSNSSSDLVAAVDALLLVRAGRPDAFDMLMNHELNRPSLNPGFQSRLRAMRAYAAAVSQHPETRRLAADAVEFAERQGASMWRALGELALAATTNSMSAGVAALPDALEFVLTFAAELVGPHLPSLDDRARERVQRAALEAPERWRPVLRHELRRESGPSRLSAARLLDVIGDKSDVGLLRHIAREPRVFGQDRSLGRGLARRLASVVTIHDLGRVSIDVDGHRVSGGEVRRKVLALLCFLLTRPRWEATREEVIEAMWPEMNPASAGNSLNQSVYFLRRVFESQYTEESTAGYVHQDSDLLWLDTELITSSSSKCADLISEFDRSHDPASAVELANHYKGRFALDFAYEDWATDYREWLHISYLHVLESQIKVDLDNGDYQRGIRLARIALEIEPRKDELELSLLRLLRRSGAHSAAAEQYSRYASVLRTDLGVDPPTSDAV